MLAMASGIFIASHGLSNDDRLPTKGPQRGNVGAPSNRSVLAH
jgi:hypothetical protein